MGRSARMGRDRRGRVTGTHWGPCGIIISEDGMMKPERVKAGKTMVLLAIFALCCVDGGSGAGRLPALGFYSSTNETIRSLEREGASYREHFMLGVAYKRLKNYKKALFHFANGCFARERDYRLRLFAHPVYGFVNSYNLKSEYYADAVAEIADIFFLYREFEYVIRFADLLSNDGSALYRDAMVLRSRALSELGRDEEALGTLEALLKTFRDPDSRSLIFIRTASLREKAEDYAGAVGDYAEVIGLDEASWQSSIAAGRIMDLKGRLDRAPADALLLKLAGSLCAQKRYDEAVRVLGEIRMEPAAVETRTRKRRLSARAYAGLDKIKQAEEVAAKAEPGEREEIRLAAADELWGRNRKGPAVDIYRSLALADRREIALPALRRVAIHLSDNRAAGFEKALLDFKERFAGDAFAEYCLWTLGREALRRKDRRGAEAYFREALSKFPDGENSDRMKFWLLRFDEDRDEGGAAERMFRDLVAQNPESTLTWTLMERRASGYKADELALEFERAIREGRRTDYLFAHSMLFLLEKDIGRRDSRLAKIPSVDRKPFEIIERDIEKPRYRSRFSGNLKRLERYFTIGNTDGINRELSLLLGDPIAQEDRAAALAHFGGRYGHHYFSLFSTLEMMRARGLRENVALMPERLLARVLPAPFGECVTESAVTFRVDANAIYAVMKAESLFHPRAVSSAGAVGLMQIMPSTARGIARGMGVSDYDLKDPCTSIRFGTKYIAGLLAMFRGDFDLVVAGYNAGAGNVRKWQARMAGEDPDYFTEFIPFSETRYYVVRARKFLIQYSILNGRR